MRARVDQHGMIVHVGVAVAGHVVFGRHVVIGDAAFRQHRADAEVTVIAIGRVPFANDVFAKARAIIARAVICWSV